MTGYVARRLLATLPLLWGALTIVFVLMHLLPGGPFDALREPGDSGATSAVSGAPAAADRLERILGADRPPLQRYADWILGLVCGDLGRSLAHRRPVAELIGAAALHTLRLALPALVVQFVLGIAAGVVAARARGGVIDRGVTFAATLLYAMPSYWLGLISVSVVSVRLGWLPVSQMQSLDAASLAPISRGLDAILHLVLPCLALALPAAGGIALYVRDEMAAVLRRPLVSAARARGLGPARADLAHGLRNALLPVVTLMGLSLPSLVGGSAVIEVLFAWPGMGRLAYQATLAQDEPLVLGCVCVATLAVVFGSLAADLLAAAVDRRVLEATR